MHWAEQLRRHVTSPGRATLALLVLVVPIYLLTMVADESVNIDTDPAAAPAWWLVRSGTTDLRGADLAFNPFVEVTPTGRLISNRPLGLSLVAVPAYALTDDAGYSVSPSTVTAALVTAGAVAVLQLALRRCLSPEWAFGSAAVFALGTATWPISAGQLWPHGPGQLFLALLLLATAGGSPFVGALASAASILVRPVTGVVPGTIALIRLARREWRWVLGLALGAALAGWAVLAYNEWAYGEPSISGGYSSDFRDRLVGFSPSRYLANLVRAIASPRNGLLVWSPVVAFALLGLRPAWRSAPRWARDAAVAGALYLLVHLRMNRASGGLLFDYRYPLEALTMAAPLLSLGVRAALERGSPRRRTMLVAAVAASILLQGVVATTFKCTERDGTTYCDVL